jgi:hypothetical protein
VKKLLVAVLMMAGVAQADVVANGGNCALTTYNNWGFTVILAGTTDTNGLFDNTPVVDRTQGITVIKEECFPTAAVCNTARNSYLFLNSGADIIQGTGGGSITYVGAIVTSCVGK